MELGKQFDTYYHASWRSNRDSIEENGLRASQPWDEHPTGVYVGTGPSVTKGYGDDIYELSVPHGEKVVEDPMEHGAHVITRDVSPKEIKRVGHQYDHPRGYTEIHLHPAEECTGPMYP